MTQRMTQHAAGSAAPRTAGRVWALGHDVDTDQLAPGRHMKLPVPELARHCLEDFLPGFAAQVAPGDVLVAGRNFGCGSSREQAPAALHALGVAAVVAESFAGLFYRNAINLGLPVVVCSDAARVAASPWARVDAEGGTIEIEGGHVACEPIPAFLMDLLRAGGLLPHLKARLAASAPKTQEPS